MQELNIKIDWDSFQRVFWQIVARFSHLGGNDIIFVILALVLPPLAVLIKVGFTTQFWINVILTALGVVPGQIHALWVVLF